MKIKNHSDIKSETSSAETSQFKINANGIAFQILSSGLYAKKIAAVLREIGCNAYDAHVAAGKTNVPFRVNLPTVENPTLAIIDEGQGMSHEQVMLLYTTYFSSNKRDSNSFIGGLGLGSKSPFAYTNAFAVQSIHNGVSYVYNCALNEEGAPTVTKLSEHVTNQPSGVHVSMVVKNSDVSLFKKEAIEVFKYFNVRPIFNIALDFPALEQSYSLTTPTYNLKIESGYEVQMGNVVYPLELKELNLKNTHEFEVLLKRLPLMLKAPIGYVQVAASREALQYDTQSQKNLIILLQQAYQDLAQKYMDSTLDKEFDNQWKKVCAMKEWHDRHIPDTLSNTVWLSYITNTLQHHPMLSIAQNVLSNTKVCLPKIVGNNHVSVFWYSHNGLTRKKINNGLVKVGPNREVLAHMDRSRSSKIIVVDDNNLNEKIKVWRNENGLPTTLVVMLGAKKNHEIGLAHATEIADKMGGVDIQFLSKMNTPRAPVNVKTKKDYVEIENRMVSVFDLRLGTRETMRFGDVPKGKKFVTIRETDPSKLRNGTFYFYTTTKSKHAYESNDILHFSKFFDYALKNENLWWCGIDGWIEVRPVEYKQLKLDEQNFEFAIPRFIKDFQSKEHDFLRNYGTSLWQRDAVSPSWKSNVFHSMESGWLGDLAKAVVNAKNEHTKASILTILDEALLGDLVREKIKSYTNMDTQSKAFESFSSLLKVIESNLNGEKLTYPKNNHQWVEWMVQKYPMTAHISSKFLNEWIESDNPTHVLSSKCAVLLRIALGLKAWQT